MGNLLKEMISTHDTNTRDLFGREPQQHVAENLQRDFSEGWWNAAKKVRSPYSYEGFVSATACSAMFCTF
eukprot:3926857-Pyramimonas_sp.AAC.1